MRRPPVLFLNPQLAAFLPSLDARFEAVPGWDGQGAEAEASAEAVVVAGEFRLDTERLERMPALKLIACFNSGYDGIDLDWARERGLPVSHAPSLNDADVADHAIGLMLAAYRQIVEGDRRVREGGWTPGPRMLTRSLGGKRLGIVGLGRAGTALGRRAQAMDMTVAWWGPRPKPEAPWPRQPGLLQLARWADILVLTSRADESNRAMVSAEVIEALGPKGLLVNVARGQLVDEDALIAALRSGTLGYAALDVFETEPTPASRWADVPNTLLTPHVAGVTHEVVARMADYLNANLAAVLLEGQRPVTPVPGT